MMGFRDSIERKEQGKMGDWQINRRLCAEIVSFRFLVMVLGRVFMYKSFPGFESMNVECQLACATPPMTLQAGFSEIGTNVTIGCVISGAAIHQT
jgi:hypothetical protein